MNVGATGPLDPKDLPEIVLGSFIRREPKPGLSPIYYELMPPRIFYCMIKNGISFEDLGTTRDEFSQALVQITKSLLEDHIKEIDPFSPLTTTERILEFSARIDSNTNRASQKRIAQFFLEKARESKGARPQFIIAVLMSTIYYADIPLVEIGIDFQELIELFKRTRAD